MRMWLRVGTIAALGLLMSPIISGCDLGVQAYDLRYRLTIEVETPQGLRTGSGVIESTVVLNPIWSLGAQTDGRVRGEAVPIDLPNGVTLFALLRSPEYPEYAMDVPRKVFSPRITTPKFKGKGRTYFDLREQTEFLKDTKPRVVLARNNLPLIVQFADIRDPTTIKRVSPEDFARMLGRGYRLRRIILAITDEEVTTGLRQRLPWLSDLEKRGASLDGGSLLRPNNLQSGLTARALKDG